MGNNRKNSGGNNWINNGNKPWKNNEGNGNKPWQNNKGNNHKYNNSQWNKWNNVPHDGFGKPIHPPQGDQNQQDESDSSNFFIRYNPMACTTHEKKFITRNSYKPKKPFMSHYEMFNPHIKPTSNPIHDELEHKDADGDTYMCDCANQALTTCHLRAVHDVHLTLENCRVMEEFVYAMTHDPQVGDIARSQWANYRSRFIQKGFAS